MQPTKNSLRFDPNMVGLKACCTEVNYLMETVSLTSGFKLSQDFSERYQQFVYFAKKNAEAGASAEERHVRTTLSSGVRLMQDLENVLEAFLRGAFAHWDNVLRSVRESRPEIIAERATEIAELQETFRILLTSKETTLRDLVMDHRAVCAKVDAVAKLAKDRVEQTQREARRTKDRAAADDILGMSFVTV